MPTHESQLRKAARLGAFSLIVLGIAVLLGWSVGGEPITGRTLIAAAAIVVAVVLITANPAEYRELKGEASPPAP